MWSVIFHSCWDNSVVTRACPAFSKKLINFILASHFVNISGCFLLLLINLPFDGGRCNVNKTSRRCRVIQPHHMSPCLTSLRSDRRNWAPLLQLLRSQRWNNFDLPLLLCYIWGTDRTLHGWRFRCYRSFCCSVLSSSTSRTRFH